MQTAERNVRRIIDDLGITYRQYDYACARVLGLAPGSGNRRDLTADQFARLTVAAALARSGGGTWPSMVRSVWAGPVPPPAGWVCLCHGAVTYGATLSDVSDGLTGWAVIAAFGPAKD